MKMNFTIVDQFQLGQVEVILNDPMPSPKGAKDLNLSITRSPIFQFSKSAYFYILIDYLANIFHC